MTKNEFIQAAYLAALPAVADRVIKSNFPKDSNKDIAHTITSLAIEIAEESFKEMTDYLESDKKGK